MSSVAKKGKRELEIFSAFAAISELQISPHTIRAMCPPHPDVLCESKVLGKMAFELVEVIDESYARRVGKQHKTKQMLNDYYEALSGPCRMKLQKQYADALVFVVFVDHLSMAKRKALLPEVIDSLIALPADFTGTTLGDQWRSKGIEMIGVERFGIKGPLFDTVAVGFRAEPVLPRIQAKFQKVYKSDCPADLLAYVDGAPLFPDTAWMPDLETYLNSVFEKGIFRKVWIFDYQNDAIRYAYPSNSA